MISDTPEPEQAPAFVVQEPEMARNNLYFQSNFTLKRSFDLVLPGDEEPKAGEHQIDIYVDATYQQAKGGHDDPPDSDEFDLNEWSVDSIDGYNLSVADAKRLQEFLGDLTQDEYDDIAEMKQREAEDDFDPPDSYDDGP